MEISSSSSELEGLGGLGGLEKEDEDDEEEIFDSSSEGKQKIISWKIWGKSSKKNIQNLNNFLFCFKESGKLTFTLLIIIIFFFVFFLLRTKPLPPLQFSCINLPLNFLLSDNRNIIIIIILSMTMALSSSVYRMNGMHHRQSRFTHDEGESPEFGFDGKGIWKRRRSVTEVSLFH